MAQDFPRDILGEILVLQGVLFMVPQDHSAIQDNMDMLALVVEYKVSLLLLNDLKVWQDL